MQPFAEMDTDMNNSKHPINTIHGFDHGGQDLETDEVVNIKPPFRVIFILSDHKKSTCRKLPEHLWWVLKSYIGTWTDCPHLSFSTHSSSCSVSKASAIKEITGLHKAQANPLKQDPSENQLHIYLYEFGKSNRIFI